MSKTTNVSLKINDDETKIIIEELKKREMKFSGVVRRLLRDFAANGYRFTESEEL